MVAEQIAFRRANHRNSRVLGSLPPTWICEYAPSDGQDPEDGWEFLSENEFQILLAASNTQEALTSWQESQQAKIEPG